MKYRVKHVDKTLLHLLFPFIFPFNSSFIEYEVQYKKHWWNKWKTCDNYDRISDAYAAWLKYESEGKCELPELMKFPHNKKAGEYVWCNLQLGKLSKKYGNEQYYAGYRPKNYHNFYYCSYGNSYETAISKLWGDLEVQKLLNKI